MSVDSHHPYADPTAEVFRATTARYLAGTGLTILFYDLIITLNKEVSGSRHVLYVDSRSNQLYIRYLWFGQAPSPYRSSFITSIATLLLHS